MEKKKQAPEKLLAGGTVFILIGLFLLLMTTGVFTGRELIWPFFIILPGFYFIFRAFSGKGREANILPGMFLTLSGIYMLLAGTILKTHELKKIWPIFMLISGISLIPYGFKKKKIYRTKIFVPSIAIILLSLFFLPFSLKLMTIKFLTVTIVWWPVLFIIMGLVLVSVFISKQYGNKNEK
ncbi:MAG: hypothetical protein RBT69_10075 [Spirochaetia bacterium]|jgi:hypothetical protein|nr:hypothetical protein [Spirochaetia bacterium]